MSWSLGPAWKGQVEPSPTAPSTLPEASTLPVDPLLKLWSLVALLYTECPDPGQAQVIRLLLHSGSVVGVFSQPRPWAEHRSPHRVAQGGSTTGDRVHRTQMKKPGG